MALNPSLVDILDKSVEGKKIKEIVAMSPEVLQGVSPADAAALKAAFNIKTIEDLATSKFVLWAQALTTLAKAEK